MSNTKSVANSRKSSERSFFSKPVKANLQAATMAEFGVIVVLGQTIRACPGIGERAPHGPRTAVGANICIECIAGYCMWIVAPFRVEVRKPLFLTARNEYLR